MKSKTNISIVDNAKIRRKSDIIIGKKGEFPSGDILDANATKELVEDKISDVAESVQAITDMAPEDFDTLKEAADAITSLQSNMATVATTGSYNDLTDKPTIPDIPKVIESNNHEYVDLGLPSGTLWATCNIGASSPEDYGDYFAWGETTGYINGKKNFSWSTYKWCKGSQSTMTKYCTDSSYGYKGFTDNKTELDLEDDAAYVNWGPAWRIPSNEQFKELINSQYTTITWTTQNGVNGYRITSESNNNSIFLPAAGCRMGYQSTLPSSNGWYISHDLNTRGIPIGADSISFSNDDEPSYVGSANRFIGASVRPVITPTTPTSFHKVAVTGDYNDLENKPTIPNVAVVNLELEDITVSAITNQDKVSQICDALDAGKLVFGTRAISDGNNNICRLFSFYGYESANTLKGYTLDGPSTSTDISSRLSS